MPPKSATKKKKQAGGGGGPSKKDEGESMTWFHVNGTGPRGYYSSYAEAAGDLLRNHTPADNSWLYVFSGDMQKWEHYNFDWNEWFGKAREQCSLNGPWTVPKLTKILKNLHRIVRLAESEEEHFSE